MFGKNVNFRVINVNVYEKYKDTCWWRRRLSSKLLPSSTINVNAFHIIDRSSIVATKWLLNYQQTLAEFRSTWGFLGTQSDSVNWLDSESC